MSTATEERVEVVVDFDQEPECQDEECSQAAVWGLTCPACGHASQLCTFHRLVVDTVQALDGIKCAPCHAIYPTPIPWRLL